MQATNSDIMQLQIAITAVEAQRGILGDVVVDVALASLHEKLAALEAQPQAVQQRKLATVLFMDMAGHTALIHALDPEENMALIDTALARLAEPIGRFGGHIARYQGDGFKAVFGLPVAHEDDPENAVRAALAVQETARHISGEWAAERGIDGLFVRIGIDSGWVFAGGLTEGQDTINGMPVNLAARLESASEPGTILISHNVYRHVRGIFDVQPQDPMAVKGVDKPVQTYVVKRAKPRAFRLATRGVEGVETRMVGRDHELGLLQDAYADALESSETQVVTVIGEAGVGKSRLLYEFDNWLELRPETIRYFKGRATPNTQYVPHSLFRDLFAYRFEILDSDSAAVALDKFRAGMAGVLEPVRADVVGHWLGFDFSASEAVKPLLGGGDLASIGRAYLTRYFRALAAPSSAPLPQADSLRYSFEEDSPVVIFLEDLQWADDTSLDLAAHLPEALPEARLLIVAVTRPSLFERRPGWSEGEAAFRRVILTPLSRRASRALVDEILKRADEAPDSLRDLIIDAAEGNPFYVEEMVKMLIDQGVIERIRNDELGIRQEESASSDAGGQANAEHASEDAYSTIGERWRVRMEKLAGLSVPPTLTGLLQARLDSLPRPEREALQRASVVGRLFWDDAVADLAQTPVAELRPTLAAVCERELIFRRERSSFIEADEYIFKHALLHDVTYETVLLKHRADFHGRVAHWLEAHAGERLNEYLGLIAEHYVRAGEDLRAAALLEQSGHEAAETGLYGPARRSLERALALREAAGETEGPAVMKATITLGLVCISLGDSPAAESMLERGLAVALAAGDAASVAEARTHLALAATRRGHYDRAEALLAAALPAARAASSRTLAVVLLTAGYWAWATGDLDAAEAFSREALELAQAMSDPNQENQALITLANVASDRRDLEAAERLQQESLAVARRANNPHMESTALGNLGDIVFRRGDYATAATYARSDLAMATELGNDYSRIFGLANLAQANLMLGDRQAAREGAAEALVLARRLDIVPSVAWAVFLFGQILIAEGDRARGLALYGLARAHPALESQFLIEINEALAELNLPAEKIEAGLAAGAALDFETVVGEILEGKW